MRFVLALVALFAVFTTPAFAQSTSFSAEDIICAEGDTCIIPITLTQRLSYHRAPRITLVGGTCQPADLGEIISPTFQKNDKPGTMLNATIEVVDDALVEGVQTCEIDLDNGSGDRFILTITDND